MSISLTTKQLLILIFIFALSLRLLGLINITLAGDFAYHWSVAREIVVEGNIPLLGPSASVNDAFHLGPFYYYLLSIPYALGNGDFRAAIIFFSLLNSLSVFILFSALKPWFSRSIRLKIIALYAVSAYLVSVQNFPWNPYILPSIIVLILYFIAKIKENNYSYLPALTTALSLALQAHATALFLLPVIAVLLPLQKLPWKMLVLSVATFLITLSPWLYADVSTNFSQTKEALAIFEPVENSGCSLSWYLQNHGSGERCFSQIRNSLFIAKFFTMSLFNTQHLVVVVAFSLISALFLIKGVFKQKSLILVWIGLPWLLYMFYSSNVYMHYFLIFFPIPLILFVLLLEQISKLSRTMKMASAIIYYTTLVMNMIVQVQLLDTMRG